MKKYILAILLLGALCVQASAHDWYPYDCCSNNDCHPIDCAAIFEKGKALVYNGFGFYDSMIRPSQDGLCHVCISNEFNKEFTPVPHCLFIQLGT